MGTASKEVVGFASLNQVNVKAGYDAVAEITYYLGFAWYGMGIGTALLDWLIAAARERGFHKLTAGIFVDNEGSTKLMHKFGFAQYGLFPRASFNTRLNRSYDLADWHKDI